MSNPVVSVDNVIPTPPDPSVTRKTYFRIVYESQRFYVYADGEFGAGFDPSDKGERFFMSVPLNDALTYVKPSFVSDQAWPAVKASASCFVSANFSVLPKIIVPSDILVDNGYNSGGPTKGSFSAWYDDKDLFNWVITSVNGAAPGTNYYKYVAEGSWNGVKYITFKAKDDKEPINTITVELNNPSTPPVGEWIGNLVVTGAFCIFLNVIPARGATSTPSKAGKNTWSVQFEFGDVWMELSAGGEMAAAITSGDGGNKTKVNLIEGRAKGGPGQQEQSDDKSPYIIIVYPAWNGVIVGSGVQEARSNAFEITPVLAASAYVQKLKKASVMLAPWSSGFDPTSPADVEVGVGTGTSDVTVSFGNKMVVTAKNCRFDIAYIPCFFSKAGWFDEWFIASDDTGDINYSYNSYAIWTANGTNYVLGPHNPVDSGIPGPVDDTHYETIEWRMDNDDFARTASEIFGSVFEIVEHNRYPVRNDNGSFVLGWTGGLPGDPNPGAWTDYIQSVSVTVGLDGSSGSITVDKYGPAGQGAEAIQCVGAIVLSVTGGYGTVGGTFFRGLAMGVGEGKNSQGATWTIPLVGLEKKLDDIALINVPFADGEPLGQVLDLLSKYAGITPNYFGASTLIRLSMSEDINVARFDWKSGTSVRAALDEVMNDVNHNYVVMDGRIYYYALGPNGLPYAFGTDWGGQYPSYKTVSVDQTPDFDDLRNEIVVLGLEQMREGENTKITDPPEIMRIARLSSATTPNIPWAKTLVDGMPGFHSESELLAYARKRQSQCIKYESLGRTSIPGNAVIRPYDKWNGDIIYSVTHNIDLTSKTWTTDLEFMKV